MPALETELRQPQLGRGQAGREDDVVLVLKARLQLPYPGSGTGGLRVTGSMWKPVRVFNKDTVPMVLTFDAMGAAQAYVGRNQHGAVRIVRVMEEGEREVVETGCL